MDNQNDIIVQKIKELKKIKPRQEWKDLTKVFLLSKIEEKESNCYSQSCVENAQESQKAKQKLSFWDKKADFKVIREFKKAQKETFFGFLENLTGIPAVFSKAICLICIFTITASGVFAVGIESQKSVAGDTLYPVKKAIEKTKIAFFLSNNKSQAHTDLASRRLEELNKIAEKSESAEEKKGKMNETIDDFKDEIETAKIALVQPKINRNTSEKVEAAKKVMAKTEEFKEILEKVPAQMPEEIQAEIGENIDEALEASEKANFAAVEQMIELDISDTEKLALVMAELEKTEDKAKETKEKAEKISGNGINELKEEKPEELIENEEISGKKENAPAFRLIKSVAAKEYLIEFEKNEENDTIVEDNSEELKNNALKNIKEAEELLEKAKEYLAKNDFKTALKLISVSNELIKSAEKVIKSAPVSEESAENSSDLFENNEDKSEDSELIDETGNSEDNIINIEDDTAEEFPEEQNEELKLNSNFEEIEGETKENKEYIDLE